MKEKRGGGRLLYVRLGATIEICWWQVKQEPGTLSLDCDMIEAEGVEVA